MGDREEKNEVIARTTTATDFSHKSVKNNFPVSCIFETSSLYC